MLLKTSLRRVVNKQNGVIFARDKTVRKGRFFWP